MSGHPQPRANSRADRAQREAAQRRTLLDTELRPSWCPKGINPHTGRPLRPGQRLPTVRDSHGALEYRCRDYLDELDADSPHYPRGSFPLGPQWELHEYLVSRWSHQVKHLIPAGAEGEWAELVFDVLVWEELQRRWSRGHGPKPPPLHRYLRPGRETWGWVARALDELKPGWRKSFAPWKWEEDEAGDAPE